MAFTGFKAEFFQFFSDIKENNNRQWFAANKQRYDHEVILPILDFIEAIAEPLEKISPNFLAIPKKHGGSMFRIYRDVRWAKDKRPYKESAAIQFRHMNGRDAHAPGFYVHLEPGNIRYGGGIWTPPSAQIKMIRQSIATDRQGWARVRKNKKLNAMFEELRGDRLKRPPRGFDATHPHIEDMKLKSFFLMHTGTARQAGRRAFVDDVADGFKAASPLMRFLCRAVGALY